MKPYDNEQWLAAARASEQTEFKTSDNLPDNDGRVFVTAVPAAPVQVIGRLGSDGQWYIGRYVSAEHGEAVSAEVPPRLAARILVLETEPVAEAMVRVAIRHMLEIGPEGLAPGAWQEFKRRLIASRFTVGRL